MRQAPSTTTTTTVPVAAPPPPVATDTTPAVVIKNTTIGLDGNLYHNVNGVPTLLSLSLGVPVAPYVAPSPGVRAPPPAAAYPPPTYAAAPTYAPPPTYAAPPPTYAAAPTYAPPPTHAPPAVDTSIAGVRMDTPLSFGAYSVDKRHDSEWKKYIENRVAATETKLTDHDRRLGEIDSRITDIRNRLSSVEIAGRSDTSTGLFYNGTISKEQKLQLDNCRSRAEFDDLLAKFLNLRPTF